MKSNITKILALILCLSCCVSSLFTLSSCVRNTPTSDSATSSSESSTEQATSEAELFFKVSKDVVVVRSEFNKNQENVEALALVYNAISEMCKENCSAKEDWYRDEMVRDDYEILIGDTNRPESCEIYDSLTYYDYKYEVISENSVVICGGSDGATLKAAQKFLLDCFGYVKGDTSGNAVLKDLKVGTSYTYIHDYTLERLSINEIDISDYLILHTDKSSTRNAAVKLQKEIEKISGIKLPLILNTEYKSGNAILVGMGNIDGTHSRSSYGSYSFAVKASVSNGDSIVSIDATNDYIGKIQAFSEIYFSEVPTTGVYDLKISDKETICATCTDEMNGLVFVNKTVSDITDGAVYSKLTYIDRDNNPVIAYVLEADLTKVSVITGTPDNEYKTTNVRDTVLQQINAAKAAGYTVYGGVNADFFNISGDYSPRGLCIKDGILMNPPDDRPWFGITKSGTAVLGTASEYTQKYTDNLSEAVGASHVILRNSIYMDIGYGTEMGYTRHPRTAAGITADGKVLLVVVDGRQSAVSNGASLGDLAQILLDCGAVDAVNLDGGGSSSFVSLNTDGTVSTKNSPSDGSLRRVFNSVLVVAK